MAQKVTIVNPETGEEKVFINKGSFSPPWKVKSVETVMNEDTRERLVKLSLWATRFGLPVPTFLDAARWILDKDCPYCQLSTLIMRRIDALGEERAHNLISQILVAKEQNDLGALENIRKSLCSDQQELPQQS